MARPKDIGTAAETAVVRYLQANGWPNAERRALRGNLDCGDVTGTPGICWEVKGGKAAETAGRKQVADWMAETETERVNSGSEYGVLVMKRRGTGAVNVSSWEAVMPASDWVRTMGLEPDLRLWDWPLRTDLSIVVQLLRRAGYGDPA